MKAIPHGLVDALADAAGIDITLIQNIIIQPGSVTFSCLVRDDEGKLMAAGDKPASMVLELPLTPYESQAVDETL